MPSLKTAFIFINHKSHKRILNNKQNYKLDFSFKSFFCDFLIHFNLSKTPFRFTMFL